MTRMDVDHCRIVNQWLAVSKTPDEQTFTSLAVLEDRLERLKHVNKRYARISFSPMVRERVDQMLAPVVG